MVIPVSTHNVRPGQIILGARESANSIGANQSRWRENAIELLQAEFVRTGETHLHRFPLPETWGIQLYIKNEATHPTGSLKHRLARALIKNAIERSLVGPGTTLVEASSGSTAVSIAYYAQLLGLDFVAVMPKSTSSAKRSLIERYGGVCKLVQNPAQIYQVAERLGERRNAHYMNQFARAGDVSAPDEIGSIALSVMTQMSLEQNPIPTWIVLGAGTGGTSATFGKYVKKHGIATKVAVVDPEGSVFAEAWRTHNRELTGPGSRIEGIGRPRVEPSFDPSMIDLMIEIPDRVSIEATQVLRDVTGISAGPSSGTNLAGVLSLIADMRRAQQQGSIVTLVCDGGERYQDTVFNVGWRQANNLESVHVRKQMQNFLRGETADPF